MSYAPLDVHFDEHPSHDAWELEHFGLQACAIAYCNRLRTDGFVSDRALKNFGKSGKGPKLAPFMVACGKWERVEGGHRVVGFLDRNPSRAQIEARIEDGRLRKVAFDKKRKERASNANHAAPSNASGNALPLRSVTSPDTDTDTIQTQTQTQTQTKGRGAPDPELATTFASALLALGHRVALGPFAWKDISSACAVHWPDVTAAERHEKLRLAVTSWARCTDGEETRGWDHRRFIAWANAGNASPPPVSKPRQVEPLGELVEVSAEELAEMMGGVVTTFERKSNAS